MNDKFTNQSPEASPLMAGKMVNIARFPGLIEYQPIYQAMLHFSDTRDQYTLDEFWLLQHQPVYTQGLSGKAEHILNNPHDIPIVASDRGGQVTYHGPGQVVIYTLIDIKRLHLKVKELVFCLEEAIILTLNSYAINAVRHSGAPGVYILEDSSKIAALGLRIRHGCAYHGISLNVNMDLSPFQMINPCGYAGLKVSQISDYQSGIYWDRVAEDLLINLGAIFGLQAILGSN